MQILNIFQKGIYNNWISVSNRYFVLVYIIPRGLSIVLDGVRTTGKDDLCFDPLRNPVDDVSASDMIPGSSSISIELLGEVIIGLIIQLGTDILI